MKKTQEQQAAIRDAEAWADFDRDTGYLEHGTLVVIWERTVCRYMVIEEDGAVWWTNDLPLAIPELAPWREPITLEEEDNDPDQV